MKQIASMECLIFMIKDNMKKSIIIIIFLVSGFYTGAFAQNTYSFNEGLTASKAANKITVLAIVSEQDTWSKKMEAVFSDGTNKNLLDNNFIFSKLDVDQKSIVTYNGKSYSPGDLAKVLGGTGYPTMVFFSPDGKIIRFRYNNEEVGFFAGYIEAADFGKMLNYFSSGNYKNTDLSKAF
ncbi:hypothetical protein BH10BAC5_BH10BAC5_05850 [soil metagenome]